MKREDNVNKYDVIPFYHNDKYTISKMLLGSDVMDWIIQKTQTLPISSEKEIHLKLLGVNIS